MDEDISQFLQLIGFMAWNLFPNGTMLFATWFEWRWPEIVLPREFEDDDFLSLQGQ